eukprot:11093669-Lingulodinium_polyedra.AAC.1
MAGRPPAQGPCAAAVLATQCRRWAAELLLTGIKSGAAPWRSRAPPCTAGPCLGGETGGHQRFHAFHA